MKSFNKFFIISTCLAFLLTGCGTSSQSNGSTQPAENNNKTTEETADQSVENGTAGETVDEQEKENTSETVEESTEELTQEENTSVETSEQTTEKIGTVATSDNQDYAIQLLDGYELIEEEPRKDIITRSDDEHTFMRIEMIPEDMTIEEVEENMKQMAIAIDPNAKPREDIDQEEMLQDAVWYESYTEEDEVHSILVKGETPMQLTIYIKKGSDDVAPFLEMARTIKK
ncbi:hypothetical protein [Bacillus sp. CGMCC 1.16541]|uniref:hypothetical protein n=1 Tax=Bacillus sp. CGMCC 1.16541 TaxID=2185143 RepID=UPI000D739BA3|nr:hypothetical protein [Bacillus sp. CGMCC 1.16541]